MLHLESKPKPCLNQIKPKPCIPSVGFTDQETVKLDLDNMGFSEVKYWASYACKEWKLDGYLLLKSSERNFHVVFNRSVEWNENVKVMAWVCRETKNEGLRRWFYEQVLRGDSTLRIGSKTVIKDDKEIVKPPPQPVLCVGERNHRIFLFLAMAKRSVT